MTINQTENIGEADGSDMDDDSGWLVYCEFDSFIFLMRESRLFKFTNNLIRFTSYLLCKQLLFEMFSPIFRFVTFFH